MLSCLGQSIPNGMYPALYRIFESWTWIFLLVRIVWVSNIYTYTSPSRTSLIAMLTRLRTERSGVESRHRQEIFLFSRISRPSLGPARPRIPCIPELFSGDKPAGAWSYSPLTSTEVASAIPGVERETLYWPWYLFITPVWFFFFCVFEFCSSFPVVYITRVYYFIWQVWVATSYRLMECINLTQTTQTSCDGTWERGAIRVK
jgi:hypothetical protein